MRLSNELECELRKMDPRAQILTILSSFSGFDFEGTMCEFSKINEMLCALLLADTRNPCSDSYNLFLDSIMVQIVLDTVSIRNAALRHFVGANLIDCFRELARLCTCIVLGL